jgi:hypothetical protein
MLLRLTLPHKATTTTVLALCPSLRLTFSLLRVFGRMRTMAKLLLVRRYIHNVRSQSTSCKRGRCMSTCCEIRLRTACVMYTSFITPNQCPCLMRPLPCVAIYRNATTRRAARTLASLSPLPRLCGAKWAALGRQTAEMRHAPRRISRSRIMLLSSISSSGSPTTRPSLLSRMCNAAARGTSWVVTVTGTTSTHASIIMHGWRIHRGVEVTESSTNKQHSLSKKIGPAHTSMFCGRWCASVMPPVFPPITSGCSRVRAAAAPILKSATSAWRKRLIC